METTGQSEPFDSALYDSATFLVRGMCHLSPANQPTEGTIIVGKTPQLLKYRSLMIELPSGKFLPILARRVEYSPGGLTQLLFDVEGPAGSTG